MSDEQRSRARVTASKYGPWLFGAVGAGLALFAWLGFKSPAQLEARDADQDRRLLMLEMRRIPEPAIIEDLSIKIVAFNGRADVLAEKIDALNKRLDRLEDGR